MLLVSNTRGLCGRFLSLCTETEFKNYGTV